MFNLEAFLSNIIACSLIRALVSYHLEDSFRCLIQLSRYELCAKCNMLLQMQPRIVRLTWLYRESLTRLKLSFLGFVLVASGAEIPDLIQSVTVARRGYGSMAVSNAIGSQIINICIGLGLPWTITILGG